MAELWTLGGDGERVRIGAANDKHIVSDSLYSYITSTHMWSMRGDQEALGLT